MEFETPKEIEDGTRHFTAAEFAALDQIEGVERPELELFEEVDTGGDRRGGDGLR